MAMRRLKLARNVAAALVVVLVVAAVAGCQSTVPTPSPSPTPTPTPTPSATPSPTPTPSPTAIPTRDPNATPTPLPTGAPGAYGTVQQYENALIAGDFEKAWSFLGVSIKARWGSSLVKYKAERTAFLAKAGARYTLELDPTNTLPLNDWANGTSWGPGIDLKNAHLISVHWTAVPDLSPGLEIWVVNPGKTGWLMYLAR
jgi:hypothetical protein